MEKKSESELRERIANMSREHRAAHPIEEQTVKLLDALELYPMIAKGFLRTNSARIRARSFWQKMQLELNDIEHGAVKSWKQWMKYWTDKKCATRKKYCMLAGNRRRGEVGIELTPAEERIITILKGAYAKSNLDWKNPNIHKSSEAPFDTDDNEIKRDTASPNAITNQNIAELSDAFHDPDHRDDAEILEEKVTQDPIFIREETAVVEAESSDRSVSPPREQTPKHPPLHRRASTTTNPKRRKIWVRVPPPESHSEFAQISERFMQLEERRIEVEAQNAALLRAVLERTAQREHVLLEALTNIGNRMIQHQSQQNVMMNEALRTLGEGLKALSRAINR